MPPDPTVKALAAQLSTLRGQVAVLAETVAELTDEGSGLKAYAPNWVGLTPAQHAKKVTTLAEWVNGTLTPQYLTVPLRPCWPAHQPALNHLDTLRAEWFRIYARKYPDLPSALVFLDRYLPGTVSRVHEILADCQGACSLSTGPVPIRQTQPQPRPA